jgi:hypothetical protein
MVLVKLIRSHKDIWGKTHYRILDVGENLYNRFDGQFDYSSIYKSPDNHYYLKAKQSCVSGLYEVKFIYFSINVINGEDTVDGHMCKLIPY